MVVSTIFVFQCILFFLQTPYAERFHFISFIKEINYRMNKEKSYYSGIYNAKAWNTSVSRVTTAYVTF